MQLMDCFHDDHPDVPILLEGLDVSYGGIGVRSSQKVLPNENLMISLSFKGVTSSFNVRVKWCKFYFTHYRVGLSFTNRDPHQFNFISRIIRSEIETL